MCKPIASGWIKNMYIFHANVVKSCDMAWYLTMSVGITDRATKIMKTKKDACQKMFTLYFTEQIPRSLIEIISWTYLFGPWQHYIKFHLETSGYQVQAYEMPESEEPECLITEGQEIPFNIA
jgi:hypothetical protein